MVISMTGFGRGEFLSDKYSLKTEIKTVNHRYNDISIRLPRHLNFLEEKIKKELKKYISRGKVDLYIALEYIDQGSMNIKLDLGLAKEIHSKLSLLNEELGLGENISINNILRLGDVFSMEREEVDEDLIWQDLKVCLGQALEDLSRMRSQEGEYLKEDMAERLGLISDSIDKIQELAPTIVLDYRLRLEERIKQLLEEVPVDQARLAEEVAIFADKSNIDEELTRFKSHIKQYFKIMDMDEPVGRKLDFLIQEMNREVNTIGSKTGDIAITNYVVEIKSEIEKLREQVQNIE